VKRPLFKAAEVRLGLVKGLTVTLKVCAAVKLGVPLSGSPGISCGISCHQTKLRAQKQMLRIDGDRGGLAAFLGIVF
jgi:hypothetical protein